MPSRIVTAAAVVIITAWAVSFLVDIVSSSYEPPPTVHALMMIVAGWAFGVTAFGRNGSSRGDS